MSKLNGEAGRLRSPVVSWISFKPKSGVLEYYDRKAKRPQNVPLSYKFHPIHADYSITGFGSEGVVSSTRVPNTVDYPLTVFGKQRGGKVKVLFKNRFYTDIKEDLKEFGGRLSHAVWGLDSYTDDIKAIQISGASLGNLFEFFDEHPEGEPFSFDVEQVTIATGKTHRPVLKTIPSFKEISEVENATEIVTKYVNDYLESQLNKSSRGTSNGKNQVKINDSLVDKFKSYVEEDIDL